MNLSKKGARYFNSASKSKLSLMGYGYQDIPST